MSQRSKERRAKERAAAGERQQRIRRSVLERWGPSAPQDSVERAGYLAAHAILEEHGLTAAGAREIGFNCAAFTNVALAPQMAPRSCACAPGCAWCCMREVTAWPAEVIQLASRIESGRGEEVSSLLARLRETVAMADAQRSDGRSPRSPCPLLTPDRTCSVHEARPSSCAAVSSSDAAVCKADAEGKEHMGKMAANLALLVPSQVAAHVIMQRGGPPTDGAGGGVDLHAGLALALERGAEAAAAAWIGGEDIFRAARERAQRRMERLREEKRARAGSTAQGLVTLGSPKART
jgi:Fe-S-cluster containining protein